MNRSKEVFADPVQLPEGVHHCGPTAYNRYKCRCRYCCTWRRLYDRNIDLRNRVTWSASDAARAYLTSRGIAVWGGVFNKRPQVLARIVAGYFMDDLGEWKKGMK